MPAQLSQLLSPCVQDAGENHCDRAISHWRPGPLLSSAGGIFQQMQMTFLEGGEQSFPPRQRCPES